MPTGALGELFWEIVQCPNIELCLADPTQDHPCSRVVRAQEAHADRQLPEPWSGDLENVPILFVGSNPGYDPTEKFPTASWPSAETWSFFADRLRSDATWRHYKAEVRARAEEVLGRRPVPHQDYALTEVVRCKSGRQREGTRDAARACADLYFRRTIGLSRAKLIACLGDVAKVEVERLFPEVHLSRAHSVCGPFSIAGRERHVAFIAHPGDCTQKRRLALAMSKDDMRTLRELWTKD